MLAGVVIKKSMRVLIACEESQAVCIEFRKLGHEAYSCDTQDCSGGRPEWHIKGDVLSIIKDNWDMMIAFPPCTYLAVTANKYFLSNPERWKKRLDAMLFVWKLWTADIEKIAIENPRSVISSHLKKADQEIHPYYFGDKHIKSTFLWLKNLTPLQWYKNNELFKSNMVIPEYKLYNSKKNKSGKSRYNKEWGGIGKGSSKIRSKTYPGIARTMAEQWGGRIK